MDWLILADAGEAMMTLCCLLSPLFLMFIWASNKNAGEDTKNDDEE